MTEHVETAVDPVGTPRPWRGRDALASSERRTVAIASAAPSVVVLLVLTPFAIMGRATFAGVIAAAAVHGSLLGLAAGFVTVDRLQARQCPGCATRSARGVPTCPTCGYDLVARPRWVCDQRHDVHIDPGLCPCGRRLRPLPPGRGIGREIVVMLKIGAWLLAFLMGMGVLLRVVG
ncbi:MAG: hypothetical protein R3249_00680 [Nitriliruptorales bacterium]|nr:hypothetical protein [Nitriliruptorales bacterium]